MVKEIFDNNPIPIVGPFGEKGTDVIVNDHMVSFNGVEDDSHETCQITKQPTKFEFCKTARKPYDKVVVEVLKAARKACPSMELSSDGDNVFD